MFLTHIDTPLGLTSLKEILFGCVPSMNLRLVAASKVTFLPFRIFVTSLPISSLIPIILNSGLWKEKFTTAGVPSDNSPEILYLPSVNISL